VNTRRRLLAALGAGATMLPLRSFAQQQGKMWRVGVLTGRHVDFLDSDNFYGPFRQGMRRLGYVEGKNLVIEWRSAEGKTERLPGLATELVNLKVDVIVTSASPATSAAQNATTVIPIVMAGTGDPVESGFVKSLARPAGNITGLSTMSGEVRLKQLEMLLAMVPKLSRVAVLVNPSIASIKTLEIQAKNLEILQAKAQKRGVKILRADARTPQEIDNAFSWIRQQKAGALIVWLDQFFLQQKSQIAGLTAKHRLPSIAPDRTFSEAGALMSFGRNYADQSRRAATYVDKIFKGAKPSDLPVEQPTTFELVINSKTAKTLGLKIPQSLLTSADKVIE